MRLGHVARSVAVIVVVAGCIAERSDAPTAVDAAASSTTGEVSTGGDSGDTVDRSDPDWLVLLERPDGQARGRIERGRDRSAAEASLRRAFPQMNVTRGVERSEVLTSGGGRRLDYQVSFLSIDASADAELLRRLREHPLVRAVVPDVEIRVELAAMRLPSFPVAHTMPGQARAWGIDSVRAPSQWIQGWLGASVGVAIADDGADFYGTGGAADDHPDFDFSWAFSNNAYGLPGDICPDGPAVPFGCYWEGTLLSHGSSTLGLFVGADDAAAAVGTAPAQSGSIYVHVPMYECAAGACTSVSVYIGTITAINAIADVRIALMEAILPVGSLNPSALQSIRDEFENAATDDQVLWIVPARNNQPTDVGYPGLWDEVLTVAAVGTSGGALVKPTWTPTSSAIDLVAPGENQMVPVNRRMGVDALERSGSSFAAPIVAGVARLALDKNPAWGASQLRNELQSHARDLGTAGKDNSFGYGLVDAACVLQQVSPCLAGSRVSASALAVTVSGPVSIGGGLVQLDGTLSGGLSPYGEITWLRREGCGLSFYVVHVGASYIGENPPPGEPYFVMATAGSFGPEQASSAIKKVGTGFPIC